MSKCPHILKRGPHKGRQCGVKPRKGVYCAKHRKKDVITVNEPAFWAVWRNKWLRQKIYGYVRGTSATLAAKHGNLEAFEHSVLTGYNHETIYMAMRGDIDVWRWLRNNRTELYDEVIRIVHNPDEVEASYWLKLL